MTITSSPNIITNIHLKKEYFGLSNSYRTKKRNIFSQMVSPIKTLTKKLRSVDGIDEFAVGLSQINDVMGAIASLSVYGIGTPFVIMGFLGMIGEAKEAREEFKGIKKNKAKALEDISAKYQIPKEEIKASEKDYLKKIADLILKKILNNIPSAENINTEKLKKDILHIIPLLTQLEKDDKEKLMKKYDTISATYFGQPALGGMALAMFPGMLAAGAEIVDRVEHIATAATISDISSSVASGIFAPANFAMSVYATLRYISGRKQEKIFKADKKLIETLTEILPDDETINQAILFAKEHKNKDIKFNNWSKKLYGKLTAPAQFAIGAGGATGLALGLTGVTAGLAFPPTAIPVGAAVSVAISAAILRYIAEKKEENFIGNANKVLSEDRLDFEKILQETLKNTLTNNTNNGIDGSLLSAPDNMFTQNATRETENLPHSTFETISQNLTQQLGRNMVDETKILTHQKMKSLASYIINHKKYMGKSTHDKLKIFEKMLKTGKKDFFHRTSLTKAVCNEMLDIFDTEKENYTKLFEKSNSATANKELVSFYQDDYFIQTQNGIPEHDDAASEHNNILPEDFNNDNTTPQIILDKLRKYSFNIKKLENTERDSQKSNFSLLHVFAAKLSKKLKSDPCFKYNGILTKNNKTSHSININEYINRMQDDVGGDLEKLFYKLANKMLIKHEKNQAKVRINDTVANLTNIGRANEIFFTPFIKSSI